MPTKSYEEQLQAYEEDSRTACQYGVKCYQKNPTHHTKYKHPPKKQQIDAEVKGATTTGKKRHGSECQDEPDTTTRPKTRLKVDDEDSEAGRTTHGLSPSPGRDTDESDSEPECDDRSSLNNNSSPIIGSSASADNDSNVVMMSEKCLKEDNKKAEETNEDDEEDAASGSSETDPKRIIKNLFLTKMPDDFYQFYDFCQSISPKDPSTALKLVDLKLVGPFDVLSGKIEKTEQDEREKYLRHWRYYYDPPEFQTILKGNDKEGLHYGYWRDVIEESPVFVAKNSAKKDCTIQPVAPNIFGAVTEHISDRLARATPFEKGPIAKLMKQLKTFANAKKISLDSENPEMRRRGCKVVAKTFHGAGIVVPYDKKTQLGYRSLAATDSQFKKILKKIDEAKSDEERKQAMVSLEEIVRLATIAADESDFGTCLELGHDLFSSGIVHVQRMGLRMLASAYNLLNRNKFLNIAEAHAKDRKKGCDLDVL